MSVPIPPIPNVSGTVGQTAYAPAGVKPPPGYGSSIQASTAVKPPPGYGTKPTIKEDPKEIYVIGQKPISPTQVKDYGFLE